VVIRTPTTEVCNAVDDNCNGVVDDGTTLACGSAFNAGTINRGGAYGNTTYVPSPGGSEHWYVVTFPANYDTLQHGTGTPTITLSGDPTLRMEIRYGSCSAGATCGPGTQWSFVDNASPAGAGAYSSRRVAWPTTVYVRLFRPSGGVCANYTLSIRRP
jgi:hypothetical protein